MYTTLIKNKNRTIISTDAEKALNKTQHAYIIKPLQKVVTGETYLNLMKATYNKYTANTILSNQRVNESKTRNIREKKQECLVSKLLFTIALDILVLAIRLEKEASVIFMILFIEKPKE